jgi:hypothetical protein
MSQLLVGVIAIFPLILSTVSYFTAPFFERTRYISDGVIEHMFPKKLIDIDDDGVPDFEVRKLPQC